MSPGECYKNVIPNSNGKNWYEYYPFLARKLSDYEEIDDDDLHQGVCVCVGVVVCTLYRKFSSCLLHILSAYFIKIARRYKVTCVNFITKTLFEILCRCTYVCTYATYV